MIDLKARMKNKTFWVSLVAMVVILANQVAGVFGYDITFYSDEITNITETVLGILALMGIIIDPTTNGISDKGK